MQRDKVNVCYTGDSGYAMQVAVSLISILEHSEGKNINFYILGDKYNQQILGRFQQIEKKYNTNIFCIDISDKMQLLSDTKLSEEPGIMRNGMISYMFARLFMGSALPESVKKVIYIDSDTICVDDISKLFEVKLTEGNLLAAVRDIWPVSYNECVGFAENDLYFTSGVMLVDLIRWRAEKYEDQILEIARSTRHYFYMHDMDLLNICFKGRIQTLSPQYGMLYLLRKYTAAQCIWMSGKTEKTYYSQDEINEAKKYPVVIHYTGEYYGRPWSFPHACSDHKLWYNYFKLSPWREEHIGKKHTLKQWCIYFVKKLIEKPIANIWLKRQKMRFELENQKMKKQLQSI